MAERRACHSFMKDGGDGATRGSDVSGKTMRNVESKCLLGPGGGSVAELWFIFGFGVAAGYVRVSFGEKALGSTLSKLESTVGVGTSMRGKLGEFWSIRWTMEKGVCKVTKAT